MGRPKTMPRTDQVAALRQLLAQLEGVDPKTAARQNEPVALSDNEIAAFLDDFQAKGVVMSNVISVFGPYPHRNRFRIKLVEKGGAYRWSTYPTWEEAKKGVTVAEKEIQANEALLVEDALEKYAAHLLTVVGLTPRSVETTVGRIKNFFGPKGLKERLSTFTEAVGKELVRGLERKPNKQGPMLTMEQKAGYATAWGCAPAEVPDRLLSYETRRNTVHEVKTFMAWCHEKGHGARKDAFANLYVEGKRPEQKAKFKLKEAKKWVEYVDQLAKAGNEGAIAALTAFFMGLRSAEVTCRKVGDLEEGAVLYLGKTKNGNEYDLIIPIQIRPYLQKLAEGRNEEEPLFPHLANIEDPKAWLLREVIRLCQEAGVQRMTPHGLRRTMGTLVARRRGLADAGEFLRHEGDTEVTERSYVDKGALRQGAVEQFQKRMAQA